MKILVALSLLFFIAWVWLCIAKMEDDMRFRIFRKRKKGGKMRFTKKEIALCKEIAQYYQKPIGFGDFFLDTDLKKPEIECCVDPSISDRYSKHRSFIPLWTFEDARKWLGERDKFGILVLSYQVILRKKHKQCLVIVYEKGKYYEAESQMPLEAILKVVLILLKEENGKN